MGFPCGSAGKESTWNAGDLGLIPGLGRSPGEEKGYPLQYSGLENFMEWIVHGVTKSWTQLSDLEHGQERSWPGLWICNHSAAKMKSRTTDVLLIVLKGSSTLWPLPLCHPSPHALCLPFFCRKLQSKTKFNQKSEKYGNQRKQRNPNQRRLHNNNKVVISHRQGPSAPSRGLQITFWATSCELSYGYWNPRWRS